MAIKPTNTAEWATGAAPIVEPTLPQKQAGFPVAFKAPAQWFNWWWKQVHLWIVWLDAFESEAHTWTAAQTFDLVTIGTNLAVNGTAAFFNGFTLDNTGLASFGRPIEFNLPTATTALITRTQIASTPHLLFSQPVDASRQLRLYILSDAGLVATYNARYSGGNWFKDVSADAWRITLGQGIRHHKAPSGAGPFADAAWIQIWNTFDSYGGAIDGLLTGHVWYGSDAQGRVLAGQFVPQPSWTNLTLSANLTPDATFPPQYYKDTTGRVWFRGFATANTVIASGAQVATLPHPIERYQVHQFFVTASATQHRLVLQPPGSSNRIDLQTDGANFPNGTLVPFEGISYRSI